MNFRIKCFLIHLCASLILGMAALYTVFSVWYPAPLDVAVGVTSIFIILLCVDIVIGPLLTFIVSKENKASLKFDLSVIALIQMSAFIYGIYTMAIGRPAWIVFSMDRFDLVQAYEIDIGKSDMVDAKYRNANWFGPLWVGSKLPQNVDDRNNLVFESVMGGSDIPQRPDLYTEYNNELIAIKKHAIAAEQLRKYNPQDKVNKILARWPEANAYIPMMAKVKPMSVLIKKETGAVIAIVELNPW